jgi:HSP20 family protein
VNRELQENVPESFERVMDTVGGAVFETVGRVTSLAQERRPLPADLLESDEAYLVVFDAPGATSSDVRVRFEERDVIVTIDRFREFRDTYDLTIPGRGLALDGRVSLPDGPPVDPSQANATLRTDGTLHVRIPKVVASPDDERREDEEETTVDDDPTDVDVDQ